MAVARALTMATTELVEREVVGEEMRRMAIRVWQRQGQAAKRKSLEHIGMRVMPAAAAVAASAAGGSLLGGLKGTTATVVGVVAIALAALGAAGTALRLDEEFDYQGRRSRELETLGWSILTCIDLDLPSKPIDVLRNKVTTYQTRIAATVNLPLPRGDGTGPHGKRDSA